VAEPSGTTARISVDEILATLRTIPWLQSLGKPNDLDRNVVRIGAWEQWPGPQDELVESYSAMLAAFTEAVGVPDLRRPLTRFGGWLDGSRSVRRAFHAAFDLVSELASARVLTGPEEDPWHPQTAAVMDARHVAGVVTCHRVRGLPLGRLAPVWRWFVAGHWPCGYALQQGRRRLLVL